MTTTMTCLVTATKTVLEKCQVKIYKHSRNHFLLLLLDHYSPYNLALKNNTDLWASYFYDLRKHVVQKAHSTPSPYIPTS